MKVQCGQCPAKYAVADERIRDKKVRIRCRRCNAAIVVDGKTDPPLVTSTPARQSVRAPSSIPASESAPPSNPESERPPSPRPVAHTILGGLEAPVEAERYIVQQMAQPRAEAPARDAAGAAVDVTERRPGMPAADRGFSEPPTGADAQRWRVAVTQQDLRWMTTEEITHAFRDGAVKLETFVFRAGMPTWLTLLEVDEIAQALAAARLVMLAPSAVEPSSDEAREMTAPASRRSSVPPPRKAQRPALAAAVSGGAEPIADSDESMPFALVSGRAGAPKNPDAALAETIAAESTSAERAPTTGAALADYPSATRGTEGAESAMMEAESGAEGNAAALNTAALNTAEAGADGVQSGIAVRELSFDRGPQEAQQSESAAEVLGAGGAGGIAEPPKGTHLWVWILLALIFVAAAALLLGPRFGVHLL